MVFRALTVNMNIFPCKSINCIIYCIELGTRLTGGREEISTPSILVFCFSADLQWSEHPSPFWTFHADVPLVKAASSRNYMGKYMFFSGFCKAPKLFVSVDEAVIESHDVSSLDRQGVTSILWERTRQNCLTPHPSLDH